MNRFILNTFLILKLLKYTATLFDLLLLFFVHCATMAFSKIQIIPCCMRPVARARAEFSKLISVAPVSGVDKAKKARVQAHFNQKSRPGGEFPIESGSNEDFLPIPKSSNGLS